MKYICIKDTFTHRHPGNILIKDGAFTKGKIYKMDIILSTYSINILKVHNKGEFEHCCLTDNDMENFIK